MSERGLLACRHAYNDVRTVSEHAPLLSRTRALRARVPFSFFLFALRVRVRYLRAPMALAWKRRAGWFVPARAVLASSVVFCVRGRPIARLAEGHCGSLWPAKEPHAPARTKNTAQRTVCSGGDQDRS